TASCRWPPSPGRREPGPAPHRRAHASRRPPVIDCATPGRSVGGGISMKASFRSASVAAVLALATLVVATPARADHGGSGTPKEVVATYETLADAILAVKHTEANLVRSF